MSAIRRLPIRVAPLPGEAIDSWIEAIAHRYDSTWSQLQLALGGALKGAEYPDTWVRRLTDAQVAKISAATEIDGAAIREMTLADLPGIVVGIDPGKGHPVSQFPWRHLHASRYCPSCLADNGGRWSLGWRTVWSFACLTHECLLASECPRCAGAPRRRIVSDVVPQPARCAAPLNAGSLHPVAWCGADLTLAPVVHLDHGHPFLVAQATINDVIDNGTVDFGIYRGSSYRRQQVLMDVRELGQYFLNDRDATILTTLVPKSLVAQLPSGCAARSARGRLVDRASPAISTAVAVTAALGVVGQPDIASAAEVLRSVRSAGHGHALCSRITTTNNRSGQTSARLRGAHIVSQAPELGASEQLRARVGTPIACPPVGGIADAQRMATCIPTLLWPQWSVRFAGPRQTQRTLRPALSVAMLLIGNHLKIAQAASLLASPLSAAAVNGGLYQVKHSEHWPDMREALYRLHRYLRRCAPPIDYARRRQLDYTALLPEPEWKAICRSTGTRPEGLSTARRYLLERLSATFAFAGPMTKADQDGYVMLQRFPARLTPDLSVELAEYSLRFLAGQGITGEPDSWSPPVALLNDLHLPNRGVEDVDISCLHHLIRHRGVLLGRAADELGTTVDIVRAALEQDPAARLPRPPARRPLTRAHPVYQTASEILTPQRFTQLYVTDGRSLKDIAALCGVSRQTVTQLARDYGITLRRSPQRHAVIVDPTWLHDQQVTEGRSPYDLSKECGLSRSTLSKWARSNEVSVGASSLHSAAAPAHKKIPKILLSTLATPGGWERLQQLPAIAEHPSYPAAAVRLKASPSTIGVWVRAIERDLGGAVLVRAHDKQPQRLTRLGARVITAVKRLDALGGP
ncbi:TniQ family protein [Mycobacterium sp.]|uniref:TniQ family protein n=1 Tax=Mycobacterium sp. TaxID=1785 RepID=UPI003F967EFE